MLWNYCVINGVLGSCQLDIQGIRWKENMFRYFDLKYHDVDSHPSFSICQKVGNSSPEWKLF